MNRIHLTRALCAISELGIGITCTTLLWGDCFHTINLDKADQERFVSNLTEYNLLKNAIRDSMISSFGKHENGSPNGRAVSLDARRQFVSELVPKFLDPEDVSEDRSKCFSMLRQMFSKKTSEYVDPMYRCFDAADDQHFTRYSPPETAPSSNGETVLRVLDLVVEMESKLLELHNQVDRNFTMHEQHIVWKNDFTNVLDTLLRYVIALAASLSIPRVILYLRQLIETSVGEAAVKSATSSTRFQKIGQVVLKYPPLARGVVLVLLSSTAFHFVGNYFRENRDLLKLLSHSSDKENVVSGGSIESSPQLSQTAIPTSSDHKPDTVVAAPSIRSLVRPIMFGNAIVQQWEEMLKMLSTRGSLSSQEVEMINEKLRVWDTNSRFRPHLVWWWSQDGDPYSSRRQTVHNFVLPFCASFTWHFVFLRSFLRYMSAPVAHCMTLLGYTVSVSRIQQNTPFNVATPEESIVMTFLRSAWIQSVVSIVSGHWGWGLLGVFGMNALIVRPKVEDEDVPEPTSYVPEATNRYAVLDSGLRLLFSELFSSIAQTVAKKPKPEGSNSMLKFTQLTADEANALVTLMSSDHYTSTSSKRLYKRDLLDLWVSLEKYLADRGCVKQSVFISMYDKALRSKFRDQFRWENYSTKESVEERRDLEIEDRKKNLRAFDGPRSSISGVVRGIDSFKPMVNEFSATSRVEFIYRCVAKDDGPIARDEFLSMAQFLMFNLASLKSSPATSGVTAQSNGPATVQDFLEYMRARRERESNMSLDDALDLQEEVSSLLWKADQTWFKWYEPHVFLTCERAMGGCVPNLGLASDFFSEKMMKLALHPAEANDVLAFVGSIVRMPVPHIPYSPQLRAYKVADAATWGKYYEQTREVVLFKLLVRRIRALSLETGMAPHRWAFVLQSASTRYPNELKELQKMWEEFYVKDISPSKEATNQKPRGSVLDRVKVPFTENMKAQIPKVQDLSWNLQKRRFYESLFFPRYEGAESSTASKSQ